MSEDFVVTRVETSDADVRALVAALDRELAGLTPCREQRHGLAPQAIAASAFLERRPDPGQDCQDCQDVSWSAPAK